MLENEMYTNLKQIGRFTSENQLWQTYFFYMIVQKGQF